MKVQQHKRHLLKYYVLRRFNSISMASRELGISFPRLSGILSGAVLQPTPNEERKLRKKLNLNNESLREAIDS